MPSVCLSRLPLLLAALLGLAACGTTAESRLADFPLSDEPLNGKFVWHDLITDDPVGMQEFYGGLFGWTFEQTTHPNGGDYVLITSDGHFVGGIVQLADPENTEYSRWLGYLSVPDVDRAAEINTESGGRTVAGPLDLGNIGRAAAVIDPQGAVIGLLRSTLGDPDDSIQPGVGLVVWNELLAADDHEAADFYQYISGAGARTVERRGGEYIMLHSDGRNRAGIMMRPDEDSEPLWLTHFGVPDPQVAAARAAELGGQVLLAPSPDVREGSMAVVTDPSGALLALTRWPQ